MRRTAVKASQSGKSGPCEPDRHHEERQRIVDGEPGQLCFSALMPERERGRSRAPVPDKPGRVEVLDDQNASLDLWGATHCPPRQI